MNISSIVVQTLPKYLDSVIKKKKKSGVCDYHMHDEKGRIIRQDFPDGGFMTYHYDETKKQTELITKD